MWVPNLTALHPRLVPPTQAPFRRSLAGFLCNLLVICHVQLDHHLFKPQTLLTVNWLAVFSSAGPKVRLDVQHLIGCFDIL